MFSDLYMYLFLALRHIVLPLALLGIIKLVGLLVPTNEVCTLVTIILACTPAASSATMFAEKYDCDAVYTSRLVVVSTILCLITMPLVVSLALI
jgi:predicted permease